jgi:hypothetical protein
MPRTPTLETGREHAFRRTPDALQPSPNGTKLNKSLQQRRGARSPAKSRPEPTHPRGLRQNEDRIAMANILVNVEKGIEIAAADALKWLSKAQTALTAAPGVIAALATLVSAVDKPLLDIAGVAANPLNIVLDIQTATDLKAVWPDVKAFLGTLGVKF